ncbi:MAG: hypothetical protein MMC23_007173 [Stictis urceolatum]|nr:hypothetical protein [Stictis urceolata]
MVAAKTTGATLPATEIATQLTGVRAPILRGTLRLTSRASYLEDVTTEASSTAHDTRGNAAAVGGKSLGEVITKCHGTLNTVRGSKERGNIGRKGLHDDTVTENTRAPLVLQEDIRARNRVRGTTQIIIGVASKVRDVRGISLRIAGGSEDILHIRHAGANTVSPTIVDLIIQSERSGRSSDTNIIKNDLDHPQKQITTISTLLIEGRHHRTAITGIEKKNIQIIIAIERRRITTRVSIRRRKTRVCRNLGNHLPRQNRQNLQDGPRSRGSEHSNIYELETKRKTSSGPYRFHLTERQATVKIRVCSNQRGRYNRSSTTNPDSHHHHEGYQALMKTGQLKMLTLESIFLCTA